MFTIGTLSKSTGVNIETIRYYERVGILPKPPRAASGRRMYDEDTVRRLAFIRHARDLGFGLTDVRALLALQDNPEVPCAEASHIAGDQLAAVEARIGRLEALRAELMRMVGACANGRAADCRVIGALAHPAETGAAGQSAQSELSIISKGS